MPKAHCRAATVRRRKKIHKRAAEGLLTRAALDVRK